MFIVTEHVLLTIFETFVKTVYFIIGSTQSDAAKNKYRATAVAQATFTGLRVFYSLVKLTLMYWILLSKFNLYHMS